jgi:signal transduction histidine kinase/CheY-like chemotaxis protein
MFTPEETALAALRREAALCCEANGNVLWADAAATRLLGIRAGHTLLSCAPDGTAAKLAELLARASREEVTRWEASVTVNGKPATMAFTARPHGGAIYIVGNTDPEQLGQAVSQVTATLSELAALHRQTERQQQELRRRNDELVLLNRELDDSARGMVALHSEVEEQASSLRRMSEVKSRVVSNVSHEFRTPLNSIISLSGLLLSQADGDLTDEQVKQLGFLRRSAESLNELVNDMLDLSRIDAGKVTLRASEFTVGALFGALRGIFRPLQNNPDVELILDETNAELKLETDEGKVSQILRNLVSNAMKFTERGSVRVSARQLDDHRIAFSVADTGIGIAPADRERVFEEFTQIDSELQRKTRGTGLGLSLSKSLSVILGGSLEVESEPGRGSVFTLTIPAVHDEVGVMHEMQARSRDLDPSRAPILVLEDDLQTLFLYESYLRNSGFQILPARNAADARAVLSRVTPAAIVLDVMLDGETSWPFLAELKTDDKTRDIPVLVVTVVNRERKARALGADEFLVKPLDEQAVVRKLALLAKRRGSAISTVLVVDDDEVSRYMVRKVLEGTAYRVIEAANGTQAVAMARERHPQVIFLDFLMPGMTAFDVIDELKSDPTTRNIPIIIHTSAQLEPNDRARLAREAASIIPKQSMTREVALGRIRDALFKAGLGNGVQV